jgi:DNA polymerase-3 subunit delta'
MYPINQNNQRILDKLIVNLPNALLLSSSKNYGVFEIARQLLQSNNFDTEYILPSLKGVIDFENGTIGVDEIKNIQSKAALSRNKKFIICISKADAMTRPAQNSFLKLLEEPNLETTFILCTELRSKLLPTVISRCQEVNLKKISKTQSTEYIKKMGIMDDKKQNQILYLANGLPGMIKNLASDSEYFNSVSLSFKEAMEFISAKPYEKIKKISQFKDDRDKAILLVDDLLRILKNTISSKPEYSSINKIDNLMECRERLIRGGNVRLCLLGAML